MPNIISSVHRMAARGGWLGRRTVWSIVLGFVTSVFLSRVYYDHSPVRYGQSALENGSTGAFAQDDAGGVFELELEGTEWEELPPFDLQLSPTLYQQFYDGSRSSMSKTPYSKPTSNSPASGAAGGSSIPVGETALMDVPMLSPRCLDSWMTHGRINSGCTLHDPRVDFVWTWLNSSDPLWMERKTYYSSHERIGRQQSVPDRHYRDHGELRASLRSAHAALDSRHRGQFWLALTDWPGVAREQQEDWSAAISNEPHATFDPSNDHQKVRVGQRPEWLRDNQGVHPIWHSEIWETGDQSRQEVLQNDLPTFNSFSIEANLHNVPGSPYMVYMNDDFFLTAHHAPSDFHPTLLGPLIPFIFSEYNYTWPPAAPPDSRDGIIGFFTDPPPNIAPEAGFINHPLLVELSCNHEWASLTRSNRMLGDRFGQRNRPGHMHIPKPFLRPIAHEVASVWQQEFAQAQQRRFREDSKTQPGDYNAMWLSEMFLVERAREAMLWSWCVAKEGYKDDQFRPTTGFWPMRESKVIEVHPPIRRTVKSLSHAYSVLGRELPAQSDIGWTYLDGPLPPFGATRRKCEIDINHCFRGKSSTKIFKRITFEKPQCGDCKLLPNGEVSETKDSSHRVPHLPLTETWNKADFSLESVTRGFDMPLRQFCERLIARYAWSAVNESRAMFTMVGDEKALDKIIHRFHSADRPSIAAINDDLPVVGWAKSQERIDHLNRLNDRLSSLFETEWPEPAPWER